MKEYRKSPWRFAFLALAVLSGGWLAFYAGMLWLANQLSTTSQTIPAATVGIIGGADGPTAIFVTRTGFDWDILIMAVLLVVGIVGFLRLRRCRQS